MNIIPSRFTTTNFGGISSSQPHQPLSTTTTSDAAFTDFMECPNLPQSDTTIINGVQIVTNDDPSSLSSPPRTQPSQEEFTENNWLPPLHPRYSYDSPPKMPIYKKSKKKGQANDNDTDDANSSTIRSKRNYTKKPLDRLKRPRNGYMIYMNEVYEDVKRKYPNLKFGELSTQIGIQWKNMTKTEQMPYHQRHEEEKNAYESAKLAMSRSNLQIVEETIGIERQVKAAELKAFELIAAKNKKENKVETKVVEETRQLSQSETPSSRPPPNYGDVAPCIPKSGNSLSVGSNEINQKVITSHYPKGNNAFHNEKPPTGNGPRKSDAAPSTVLRKLKPKPDIPITPISPDFSNRALQLAMPKTPSLTTLAQENARSIRRNFLSPAREAQRVNYFKQHFPDLNVEDERKNERMECEGVSTPQSVGGSVVEDVEQSEMKNLESDDDEEKIDQLLPSDQSDTEMEGIEISNASPSSTRKSPDTSTIWYLPINGTIVSSGLTPFRKRKVIRTEDSEEEVEPKRFKENRISQIDEMI
ncbi:9048_t:CDS:2 [Funneliformis mosseae]|uniref:9048_t:CDS:1 n=1 Tax=Funneliformis mosseae TaxID=27381 RepID=A0A9N8UZG0_FUNMO|nr:9048_t:CDS:2 [Funneliformis mosseae]